MKKVLYVEDNPLNLRLVKRFLQTVEVQLLCAMDGLTGLEMAIQTSPDLILTDINLPLMDGLELTDCLKKNAATKDIPIIALTANAMHGDRERFLAAGCDDYLPKPLTRLELLNALKRHLANFEF